MGHDGDFEYKVGGKYYGRLDSVEREVFMLDARLNLVLKYSKGIRYMYERKRKR